MLIAFVVPYTCLLTTSVRFNDVIVTVTFDAIALSRIVVDILCVIFPLKMH